MPTIGFDTSAINALVNDGAAEPLMKALQCGFEVRLLGMNAEELLSTRDPVRREALLARCQRLLASGQCLWPPHEILRLLITAHLQNPTQFNWAHVNVRARVYELAIISRDFTDELCIEQRNEQFKVQETFKKMWSGLRPQLDAILANEPEKRPGTYHDAVAIATNGVLLCGIGQELYRHVTDATLSNEEIKEFMEVAPPFRAACYGLVMGWFNGALKQRQPGEPEPPGRNDLLMAAYLPYCDRFVTHDWPQEKNLREIASEATIACEVLSYEDFCGSFIPVGVARR